jgi:glycosyltransferase involved in cell wall biosynthesis
MQTFYKKFYISSFNGPSGICKYSRDFYELILKERGYIFLDSAMKIPVILSAVASRDHVHIEIGIFQKKEIEILFTMLRANYKNVVVTLHDAPLIKYPFYEFKNPLLNGLSKAIDQLRNGSGALRSYAKKIKSIYVLSRKGQEAVRKKYGIDNVYFLPHVMDLSKVNQASGLNNNFIYFGFIGRNKGIEYALQVHQEIVKENPDIHFYVAGKAMGKEKSFYNSLREKYTYNVHFLGFVPDEQLPEVFDKATFAMLLFKNYRFFWPFSGSVLYSLQKGKILLTNEVNTVPEIIQNGKNGIYLTHKLKEDIAVIKKLMNNRQLLKKMQQESYQYLVQHHSVEIVKERLID